MTEPMTRFAIQRVKATPEALQLIERLRERHGDLAFIHSAASCEGSAPICLTKGELLPSPSDTKLGEIGASPFYVDSEQYERWGRPSLVIDVVPGPAGGFSLEGLEEVHFVTRTANTTPVLA
jgi:uncharacterized protein (DUF779 family)